MKNRKEKVYQYGFDQEKELQSYLNIGVKSKKKNSRYQYLKDFSEWKKHIEHIAPSNDKENFEHYILKNIRDNKYFLQSVNSIVIPLEAAAFTLICGAPKENNYITIVLSLMAVVVLFSVFYFKIKNAICFWEDCYAVLFSDK